MTQQLSLGDKIEQLQRMAENVAWNLGSGRKHKVSDSVRGEFHYSLWDVAFTNSDGDLHIISKGSSLLDRPTSSKATITYRGKVVLNVDEGNREMPQKYLHGKEWEEELERLYCGE